LKAKRQRKSPGGGEELAQEATPAPADVPTAADGEAKEAEEKTKAKRGRKSKAGDDNAAEAPETKARGKRAKAEEDPEAAVQKEMRKALRAMKG